MAHYGSGDEGNLTKLAQSKARFGLIDGAVVMSNEDLKITSHAVISPTFVSIKSEVAVVPLTIPMSMNYDKYRH